MKTKSKLDLLAKIEMLEDYNDVLKSLCKKYYNKMQEQADKVTDLKFRLDNTEELALFYKKKYEELKGKYEL